MGGFYIVSKCNASGWFLLWKIDTLGMAVVSPFASVVYESWSDDPMIDPFLSSEIIHYDHDRFDIINRSSPS